MQTSAFSAKIRAVIAQITDASLTVDTVDLNNCDREPIHIPNAIQPHGVLIGLDAHWQIVYLSCNTERYLGRAPETLLQQPLDVLLDSSQQQRIRACLDTDFEAVNPLTLDIAIPAEPKKKKTQARVTRVFSAVVHRSDDCVLIELEPAPDPPLNSPSAHQSVSFFDFYTLIKRPISRFQRAASLAELCEIAVEEVRQITGFDRVMVYRFDEDGSGYVIAEARDDALVPYLGLHYPATDIPKQAKILYRLNLLRIIPDVAYEPVAVLAAAQEPPLPPVDMSLSVLRSVSPLHTEYLANMGVRASMSISLTKDDRLWGLIACHHNSPRQIPYEHRTICEFLGQAVALELATKEMQEDADSKLRLQTIQARFVERLTQSSSLTEGLTQDSQLLLGLTGASGVAYCDKGNLTLLGETPSQDEIQAMLSWLGQQLTAEPVYATDALPQVYPPAASFQTAASGLLALAISQVQQLYVLWFRPEVIQTVDWAGNPDKPFEVDETGEEKMSPRRSFELWQQEVHGRSLPWKPWEVEAALELRSAIIGLVLQRADELAALNSELERSNIELDAFAYIASHDLKEPLRGIHNYSSFLIEDYGQTLGEDGTHKLETLMRLTQRMEDLINSLLHYSRLGRAELEIAPVDLNRVVEGVIELLKMSQPGEASFEVPRPLPTVECDRTQITELFTNLLTNGIKYNDKAEKQLEVGYLSGPEAQSAKVSPPPGGGLPREQPWASTIFYVHDNGIGIQAKHLETVFRIFKRLHGPKRYGGGTGAGLTIAKKIVERHGGSLWVQSVYGEGSTFYFTLGSNPRL